MNQANIDQVINEGGEGYSFAAKQAAETRSSKEAEAEKKFEVDLAKAKAAFAAEWTLEVFNVRRAEWNTEIASLAGKKVQITASVIRDLEQRLGYTMFNLKDAKSLLNITN